MPVTQSTVYSVQRGWEMRRDGKWSVAGWNANLPIDLDHVTPFVGSGWPMPHNLVLLLALYKLSTSQHDFVFEDGGSVFLQNTGIYQQVHVLLLHKDIHTYV